MAIRSRKVRKTRSGGRKYKRQTKTRRRKCVRCSKKGRTTKKHKMRGG